MSSFPIKGRASVAEIIEAINKLADEQPLETSVFTFSGTNNSIGPSGDEEPEKHIRLFTGAGAQNVQIDDGFEIGTQILFKENAGETRDITVSTINDTIDGSSSIVISKPYAALILTKVTSSLWITQGLQAAAISKIDDFLQMSQTVSENMTIENANAISVGPVVVEDGVTVEVGEDQRWVVL